MSMNDHTPAGHADDGAARANFSGHAGYPAPSDTYNPRDQGTDWPPDAFTTMILSSGSTEQFTPARHSYDGDGNMEAYEIAGPYAAGNEASRDVGSFTGATGPTGHVTPAAHPEVTAS